MIQACFPRYGFCNSWLYDLASDVGETENVSKAHPQIVEALAGALDDWESELTEPGWPGAIVGARDIDGLNYVIRI